MSIFTLKKSLLSLAVFVAVLTLTISGCGRQPAPSPTLAPPAAPTKSPASAGLAAHAAALLPAAQEDAAGLPAIPQYNIQLDVDYDKPGFQGSAQIAYTNLEDIPLDRLYFRLFPNGGRSYGNGSLGVTRAAVGGKEAQTALSLEDSVLEIRLPQAVQVGEQIQIALEFTGAVPRDFGGEGYGLYNLSDGVLTLAGWYPILAVYDDEGWNLDPVSGLGDSVYSDMAYYTVDLTTPSDLQVAATGSQVSSEAAGDDQTRRRFVSGSVRDFCLVLSPDFQVVSTTVDGTTVGAYYLPDHEAAGQRTLEIAADALRAFNEKFGPYPYTELDVVDAPMSGASGVEFPGIVLVASDIYGESAVTAHEVAHQWWYNVVGNDVIDEPWLDEALTSYSEAVYFEYAESESARQQHIEGFQRQYERLAGAGVDDLVTQGLGHFEAAGSGTTYSAVVYTKGALFFHAVREAIGDEAFFRALQNYYQANKYQIATPDDLLSTFKEAADRQLDDLYQEWLYSKVEVAFKDVDEALFQQLSSVFDLFRTASDQIWTGDYRLDREPLLLVRVDANGDAQHGYLINHPDPESFDGAEVVSLPDDLNLPPVYRLAAEALPHPDRLAKVPFFDFSYPANGADVYLMKYTEPQTDHSTAPTTFDWTAFFAHEVFHRYQMIVWQQPVYQTQDVANYPLEADNIALIYLEHHLLLDALSAGDDQARDAALRQFLAVRSLRMEKWDVARTMDNTQELNEGTARYIERRMEAVSGQKSNQPSTKEYLGMALDLRMGVRSELAFGRFYSTGAALGALMDELGLDWKPQIEAGQTPYDILAAHYDITDRDELVQQAKAAHDYAALQEKAAQDAEKAASEPTDIFTDIFEDQGPALEDQDGNALEEGKELEPIQKPYQKAPEHLLPAYVPEGWELMGSFQYTVSELSIPEMGTAYSPHGKDVTVVDFEKNGEQLRISRSAFPGGTLKEWRSNTVAPMSGEVQTIAGTEVMNEEFGDFSVTGFAYNDEWIIIEGPVSLEENFKIATSLLGQ